MTSLRLSKDLQARLDSLSNATHRPKSYYIKEALAKYLEDMEDTYIAIERITKKPKKLYKTKQVLESLDV